MLTEKRELRNGDTPWDDEVAVTLATDALPTSPVDIVIIGAGITGSIIAERLTANGHTVAILDRREPAMGSSAASTAQIMWTMDVPLTELAGKLGEAEAARRWKRVYRAVADFAQRIGELGIDAELVHAPTVYLEGSTLDADGLEREAAMLQKYGLPSIFLEAREVAARFGIGPRAAIVSEGGFTIDPVGVAHGMLAAAQSRGAAICFPHDAVAITHDAQGIIVELGSGDTIKTDHVIVATGYERAPWIVPDQFEILSTFVMATPPGTAPAWHEQAMIWEASDPYLYLRSDADGRIICGGEDQGEGDEQSRDAQIQRKAGTIAAKSGALLGRDPLTIERAWAATFASSPDGLPAIGPAANLPNVWLAAGYGGNGIAFSALAAEIIGQALNGSPDPDAECFDPYRFGKM